MNRVTISRRTVLAGMAAAALIPALPRAHAQDFSKRPLTILVTYPAGGPADLMARAIAEVMSERLGRPVLVDNRPGGGGQVAASALLRAPSDGHTMMIGDTSTLGINKAVYPNFSFDPINDITPVAPLMLMPLALYVPKTSPFNSVTDLVAGAKTRPLNYASQGSGSLGHLLGEMLKAETGGQFNHVPYKGSAPAMNDLLGGQVDLLFDGIGPGLPYVTTGKLKALAVGGTKRLPQLPEVPTTAEAGLPSLNLALWLGVVVRAGTPAPLIARLHGEISHVTAQPKVTKRFSDLGFQFMAMSSEEFGQFVKREVVASEAIVRTRRIVLD
ncbi:Bug family tripartite tricarboxylate transporter substrate binding protein [Hydrogenophaga sp. OTU3427]|uniref:Bug family tripartite tricarboxylate transporter substrate binding protein n=1 Tax=Hydrogenophaga sp. OTU3427 TaxID=3043856 RepID=UPI00313EDEA5